MKKISLTQGKNALVDDQDFEWLNQWKWCYNNGYAVRQQNIGYFEGKQKQKKIYMHRVIMKTPIDLFTDHTNHNTLDNRKLNLRICTNSENQANKKGRSVLGFKGVSKSRSTYRAIIRHKGKAIYGGRYKTPEEAACVYNNLARKYFGEFAQLNEVN